MTRPSALDDAWRLALAAPSADQSPWRVLADLLLSEGDPRGELMQLDLDAELAPLKGLARVRRPRLLQELREHLLPPGVTLEDAVITRGVMVECTHGPQALAPTDPRWRTLRRLRFDPRRQPHGRRWWEGTPLAGGQLWSVERIDHVEDAALELIAAAPPMPRLRRLGLTGSLTVGGYQAPDWARLWPEVLRRHAALRELELGTYGLVQHLEAQLSSLPSLDLEVVTFEESVDWLPRLQTWRREASPRFRVEVALRQRDLGACVRLDDGVLTVRASPGKLDEAVASVRGAWPANLPMPKVVGAR